MRSGHACPGYGKTEGPFRMHDCRRRTFRLVLGRLVQGVRSWILRWRCLGCGKRFTDYPPFRVATEAVHTAGGGGEGEGIPGNGPSLPQDRRARRRRRPSRATAWRKWKQYCEGGFEALFRKRRSDRGRLRKATAAMIAKAIELKTEQPYRSDVPLNQFLQSEFGRTIPKPTLYRHLKRAGATRLKLGISQRKVRRRWTPDYSNALWQGDSEDGPYVLEGGQVAPAHLLAFKYSGPRRTELV